MNVQYFRQPNIPIPRESHTWSWTFKNLRPCLGHATLTTFVVRRTFAILHVSKLWSIGPLQYEYRAQYSQPFVGIVLAPGNKQMGCAEKEVQSVCLTRRQRMKRICIV